MSKADAQDAAREEDQAREEDGEGEVVGGADVEYARAVLERVKSESVAQLLFKAARLLNEHALAQMATTPGLENIRPSHAMLFPHISLDGTRASTIAERLGISRQAVGQLVDEMQQMGIVERVRDPDDGRAKLVRFVRNGEGVLHGVRRLIEIESRFATALGEERWRDLGGTLLLLIDELDGEGASD